MFTTGKKFSTAGRGGGHEQEYEEMDGSEEGVATVPMRYVSPPEGDSKDPVDVKEGRDYELIDDDEVVSTVSPPGTSGSRAEMGDTNGGMERLYEDMDGEMGALAGLYVEMGGWEGQIDGEEGSTQLDNLGMKLGGQEEEAEQKNEDFTIQKNEAYAINFRLPNSDD